MPARVYQLDTNEIMVSSGAGPYAHPRSVFIPVAVAAARSDGVRGDLGTLPDGAVIYIGETRGKHYYRSNGISDLRIEHRAAIEAHGHVLLDGVDGGWARWKGRPEWSETYIDVTGAEVVTDA